MARKSKTGGERWTKAGEYLSDNEWTWRRSIARMSCGFIYKKIGDCEAAKDLTGDVFLKALLHLDPDRGEHSAVAWLYQVARNAVVDYWRTVPSSQGAQVIPFEEALLMQNSVPTIAWMRQEQAAGRSRVLLEQLPDSYRVVLSYRLLEGLSVAETASRMGIKEGYVKVLQHRALKRAATLRV